jgi:hypothetical protein
MARSFAAILISTDSTGTGMLNQQCSIEVQGFQTLLISGECHNFRKNTKAGLIFLSCWGQPGAPSWELHRHGFHRNQGVAIYNRALHLPNNARGQSDRRDKSQ